MVWRVKLVAELEPSLTTEVDVARLERDEQVGLADLGLRLAEAKQLAAAPQAEMVPTQVAVVGERRRSCEGCGGVLASKGHYSATFRSLFGDVPVRVRRMNKKQQMRWNSTTLQPFLEVRTAVLNDTLEDAFRHRYSGFRSANDNEATAAAAE